MKFAVFTSCSNNYLPKARALAESLKRHHPDAPLVLCLNDKPAPEVDFTAEPFADVWTPADLGYDRGWIFTHNVMELCTAVKGRALERLFERYDADFYLYLDPDVYVYAPLDPIAEYMGDDDIGLAPHILKPEETEIGVRLTEMSVTEHGIYNLGHLIVRRRDNGRAFAAWWRKRLDAYCYDDKKIGLFTDQRWVDLAPAIFDGVRIVRQPNLDVASWNLASRDLRYSDSNASPYSVDGYDLLTYHFSGTGPAGTHRRIREIFAPHNEAAAAIEKDYEAAIARHGQGAFENYRFAFDYFDDGVKVSAGARKLYRDHQDLQAAFPDPYAAGTAVEKSFAAWLSRRHPRLIDRIAIPDDRLEHAFNELFDETYYLERYPAVAKAVKERRFRSALEHYIKEGARLLYDPNEFFCASYYYERAKDLDGWKTSGVKPERDRTLLWHYLTAGLENGVEPIEHFDSRWYIKTYSDLENAFHVGAISSPLGHFLTGGAREGRSPGLSFNADEYMSMLNRAGDKARVEEARKLGAFRHFIRQRGVEGRA